MLPPHPTRNATDIRALATLLSAGLSAQQGIESLLRATQARQTRPALQAMLVQLQRGTSLTTALQSQRWCSHDRAILLGMAEKCGRLPEALAQLANEKELAAHRIRRFQSRLGGTLLLVFLAALLAAGLASQKSDLPFWHYFTSSVPALMQLVMGAGMLGWLLTRDRSFWATLSWMTPARLTGTHRMFEVYWAGALGMALEAGMDLAAATRQLKSLLRARHYQAQMLASSMKLKQGQTLSLAVAHWPLSARLRAAINTGENAGTLPEALRHFVTLETRHLTLTQQTIDEWLPRGFYLWAMTLAAGFF